MTRPRRADLTGLPTATSRAPCPFCHGRRWVPWWAAGLQLEGQLRNNWLTLPVVDVDPEIIAERDFSADECCGCGAVVAGPVAVRR